MNGSPEGPPMDDRASSSTAPGPEQPVPSWEEQNNAYLAAALRWLRLRLVSLAPRPSVSPQPQAPDTPTPVPAQLILPPGLGPEPAPVVLVPSAERRTFWSRVLGRAPVPVEPAPVAA